MKSILAGAVLMLAFSIPAQAQKMGGSSNLNRTGGGASAGGGIGSGSIVFHTFPPVPPAQFQMTTASGSKEDFRPSVFVSYDQAVANGQAILGTKPKTIVELARESRTSRGSLTTYVFAQDSHGNLVTESRE